MVPGFYTVLCFINNLSQDKEAKWHQLWSEAYNCFHTAPEKSSRNNLCLPPVHPLKSHPRTCSRQSEVHKQQQTIGLIMLYMSRTCKKTAFWCYFLNTNFLPHILNTKAQFNLHRYTPVKMFSLISSNCFRGKVDSWSKARWPSPSDRVGHIIMMMSQWCNLSGR